MLYNTEYIWTNTQLKKSYWPHTLPLWLFQLCTCPNISPHCTAHYITCKYCNSNWKAQSSLGHIKSSFDHTTYIHNSELQSYDLYTERDFKKLYEQPNIAQETIHGLKFSKFKVCGAKFCMTLLYAIFCKLTVL